MLLAADLALLLLQRGRIDQGQLGKLFERVPELGFAHLRGLSQRSPLGPMEEAVDLGFRDALSLANDSPYGLTACIHTRSLHRAVEFTQKVQAGVAVVNAGTYGSEPHMPFGGVKQSGNGWREPGTEALDVYSELKDIYINIDPGNL